MESSDFSKLEAVVEKLLATLSSSREENAGLLMQVTAKDKKIEELEQKIQAKNSEHDEINNRVSSLINSIEDWEKTVADASTQETAPENTGDNTVESADDTETQNSEGPLFNAL